ncbi:MAG: hypothetical protein GEU90_12095 [Gemmatimonas sp.]|nr:hypothetical protein [Gemmatimonas sp.]
MDHRELLSPEASVLLLALNPGGRAKLDSAVEDPRLDWGRLFWLAEREKATPVLWSALRELPPRRVPAEASRRMEQLAAISDFRMLRLEQLLIEALSILAEQKIDAVLLKGAALCATVYGSFAARPMYDVDLLLRAEDAETAWEALRRFGWRHDEGECPREFYQAHHHLPPLDDPAGTGLAIELHTSLGAGIARLSVQEIIDRSKPVEIGGARAFVPAVEHQVLHLCTHFAWSHMLRSSAWRSLRDLRQLVADAGLVDWDAVLAVAAEARAESSCYWTFRIARALTAVSIPDRVLAELAPRKSEIGLAKLERHYLAGLFAFGPVRCPSNRLSRALWTAGMAPRQSGHGRLRPWSRDEEYPVLTGPSTPTSLRSRFRRRLRAVSAWGNYLRFLLAPATVERRSTNNQTNSFTHRSTRS